MITGKFVFHRHPREFVNGRVGQVLKSIGQASIKNTLVNSSLYPCLSRNPPFSNSSTSSVVNSLSYGAEPAAIGSGFGCESLHFRYQPQNLLAKLHSAANIPQQH